MKKEELTIGKPYILRKKDCTRLCAEIKWPGRKEKKVLYFETEIEYEEGFCVERADAFLAALLIAAMEKNYDIVCQAPVSEKLYYQFTVYYIPILARYNNCLNHINIHAMTDSRILCTKNGVAAGASGGVDSLYSIISHKDIQIPGMKLTHLLFNNVCTVDNQEERIRTWFYEKRESIKNMADEYGIPLISMYTNMYEFYPYPYKTYNFYYASAYASCVLALQHLISIYYQSAGVTLKEFNIESEHDAADYDVFNLKCLCNENVTFYSSGTEKTRLEKVGYISDDMTAQKYLSVCSIEVSGKGHVLEGKCNCGICAKCLRTESELYAFNRLDSFSEAFYIEKFKSNPQKYIAKMTCENSKVYAENTLKLLKEKRKLHIKFYFWMLIYRPVYFLLRTLRGNRTIRKLYYLLRLDIKIHGFRHEGFYQAYMKEQGKAND